ncbi:hypothetical protein [Gilvibacter sp.]|uniref:hypothetical protein n=1 Tax=Gilvibacter sp. TaxID=2729997 RepID=UPI0025C2AAAB|nr:hypothetical protein [Gilvibacter sp.]NQX77463.1 hypothetical protein [Gilvibacter sp.]
MGLKPQPLSQIKKELQLQDREALIKLCLELGRFKRDNKEMLSYLLFDAQDEEQYISALQADMDASFESINTQSHYYIKKSVRKILRELRRFIRYSNKDETAVELLMHFCYGLTEIRPSVFENKVLTNIFWRQINQIEQKIGKLHEDLQHDYTLELEALIKPYIHDHHIS